MSIAVDIADALVAHINAVTHDPPVTAARAYKPLARLDTDEGVKITVVPKSRDRTPEARRVDRREFEIDLAIQKRVGVRSSNADIDDLMTLSESIEQMTKVDLATDPPAIWTKTEVPALWDPTHYEESGVFTSVLTLTYTVKSA